MVSVRFVMKAEFLENQNWARYHQIDEQAITKNEELLGKIFPKSYKILMQKYSGGTSKLCMFKAANYPYELSIDGFMSLQGGGVFTSNIGNYYSEMHYEFANPIENMSRDLIIFGGEGCGDYICFDYRKNQKTDNPPIVYWKHDAEPGKDVF